MPELRSIPTDEHTERLRKECPPGSTLYTILRHVSRSGMQRRISVVCISGGSEQGDPLYIADLSASTARVLDRRLNRNDFGIVCNGAGMDMGFELVYSLAQALYGDGYALSQRWI